MQNVVIRFQAQSGNCINQKLTLLATGQTHIIFPLLISHPIFSTHASFSSPLTLLISIPSGILHSPTGSFQISEMLVIILFTLFYHLQSQVWLSPKLYL